MLDPKMPLGECTFVAFDTETTGTGAGARLLEIAGSRFRGEEFLGRFDALIDPEVPIPEESIRVHQITEEMVRGQSKAKDVLPAFFAFAGDAILVAHNAPFDASIIGLELTRHRLAAPANPILDSLKAARRMYPAGAHSLDTLIDLIGLPRQDARHRAFGDAELVRHLVRKMTASLGGDRSPIEAIVEFTGEPEFLETHVLEPPLLPEAIRLLEKACREKTKVNLHFDSGPTRAQKKIVKPSIYYDWNGTTFLEAICDDEGFSKTFRVEKIVKVEPGVSSGFLF